MSVVSGSPPSLLFLNDGGIPSEMSTNRQERLMGQWKWQWVVIAVASAIGAVIGFFFGLRGGSG